MKFIYAVLDLVAKELVGLQMYTLFTFRTDEQAIRYFTDITNDPSSVLHKHVADYDLICVGVVDEKDPDNIALVAEEKPRVVISGAALVALQNRTDVTDINSKRA